MAEAGREARVVPIPETQASSFSELCSESAHVNESIVYMRKLSESFSTRLVPQVAGTWVFFEARYLILVRNMYQSLRGVSKLIAKRNCAFVWPGERR
jgi:hypothetical protein